MQALIWGFDALAAMLIEDDLAEALAPCGKVAVEARAKAEVPADLPGFVDLARRYDVIALPLTLPCRASLLLAHVLHRTGSRTRTLLKTAGNPTHALPLFDMLYPPTAAGLRDVPPRIGDPDELLALERRVFLSNACFGGSDDMHPAEAGAESRWSRYLRARQDFLAGKPLAAAGAAASGG